QITTSALKLGAGKPAKGKAKTPHHIGRASQLGARWCFKTLGGLRGTPRSFKQPVAARPTTPLICTPKKRYLKFKSNNGQCKLCPWHMKYLHYGGSATAFGGKADILKYGGMSANDPKQTSTVNFAV